MQLHDYINMNIQFLRKLLNSRYGVQYTNFKLDEILTLTEQYKEDIGNYILYSINPLYDFFVEIGINDENEMRKILGTLFYVSMKNDNSTSVKL